MNSLVQKLFDGPLDIVGDVHGEFKALKALLEHLGYSHDGIHQAGRKLVFVGDLTDRGPDSPAVVSFVDKLIRSGHAQCVLGNHDLNILLRDRKHDNNWFFGEEFFDSAGNLVRQELATEAVQQDVIELFAQLPLALERNDLRVVHACWDERMIATARDSNDALGLYKQYQEDIERRISELDLDEIDKGLRRQNDNPVKKLTSGPEERVEEPFEASGKLRYERRVPWWSDYDGPFCVFGHYSIRDGDPRGGESSFCIDFGVAKRWEERLEGKTSGFSARLAAFRWPEREVVFDDGESRSAGHLSWIPGGGIVLEVHPANVSWELPSDATKLPSFHVTLIGRKVFLDCQEAMAAAWPRVQETLPLPPKAELDCEVKEAKDMDRKTWYLHIHNQEEFQFYAQQLTEALVAEFGSLPGTGFAKAEEDRYFHLSVANNRGGDPLESIGSIRPSQ